MSKRNLDFSDDITLLQDDLLQFDQSLQSQKPKPGVVEKKANLVTGEPRNQDEHPQAESTSQAASEKQKPKRKERKPPEPTTIEWSSPTAGFNTRIPPEMGDLIDDLVYKLRKKGNRKLTKQQLAIEAFCDLLKKHGVLQSRQAKISETDSEPQKIMDQQT